MGFKQERSNNYYVPDLGLGSKAIGSLSSAMLLSTLGYVFPFYHNLGFEVQVKRNLEAQHKAVCEYAEHGDLPCYISPAHILLPCSLENPETG